MTAKEQLLSMCADYGKFCGRWHSNEEWQEIARQAETMTEEGAKAKIETVNREAQGRLWQWRMLCG